MIRHLFHRFVEAPPLPRRLAWEVWERLWWDGMFRGATLASIAWLAAIVLTVVATEVYRRGRLAADRRRGGG